MKKITLLAFLIFLFLGLIACSNQKKQTSNSIDNKMVNTQGQGINKKDVREVVWGQLSEQQKKDINGTWKDGKVSKVTLEKNMMSEIKDKSYEGKEVYRIMFPGDGKSEPNFQVFYADVNTFNCIGYDVMM